MKIDNRWHQGASDPPVDIPEFRAAYGARWIDRGDLALPDILQDRQGFAYDEPADRDSQGDAKYEYEAEWYLFDGNPEGKILCELGEPCPDELDGCDGIMITWQPIPEGVRNPVDELPQVEFDAAAARALASLREKDHAFVDLSPGDATRYRIAIVGEEEPHRLWIASNFGPLVILPDTRLHWDYVSSHMLDREHEWTARVITRFLNTLRYLKENA